MAPKATEPAAAPLAAPAVEIDGSVSLDNLEEVAARATADKANKETICIWGLRKGVATDAESGKRTKSAFLYCWKILI